MGPDGQHAEVIGTDRWGRWLTRFLLFSLVLITIPLARVLAEKYVYGNVSTQLHDLLEIKAVSLERHLVDLSLTVEHTAQGPDVRTALSVFSDGLESLAPDGVEALSLKFRDDFEGPVHKRMELVDLKDGTAYSAVHRLYHPWLSRFVLDRGFYDVMLIDGGGMVVYSVRKEADFLTNLRDGPWRKSGLAAVFAGHFDPKLAKHTAFSDFAAYEPSQWRASAFLAAPIKDIHSRTMGVMAFQISSERFSQVIGNVPGLGRSGQILLVGRDGKLRADTRFIKGAVTSQVIKPEEMTWAEPQKIQFQTGHNLRGEKVYRLYRPLNQVSQDWLLVAEIDVEEIEERIEQLALIGSITTVGGGLLMFLMVGLRRLISPKAQGSAKTSSNH